MGRGTTDEAEVQPDMRRELKSGVFRPVLLTKLVFADSLALALAAVGNLVIFASTFVLPMPSTLSLSELFSFYIGLTLG
jgi:hypothetical protein